MPDDVSVGEPGGGGGGKLFGLPTPIVLIGGGILGVLALVTLTSKKSGGDGTVPMSTAVQLGDIQQRQLEIMQNLSTNFAGASAERSAYNQNVLQALAASETGIKDQLDALNQSINGNFANMTAEQKAQRDELMAKLAGVQDQQTAYYNSLHGDINTMGGQLTGLQNQLGGLGDRQEVWGNYLNYYLSLLSGKIDALPQGGPVDPTTFTSWDAWYGGWRSMFGRTGPGNPFDLNKDNIVDIRDYGIGRELWKVQ